MSISLQPFYARYDLKTIFKAQRILHCYTIPPQYFNVYSQQAMRSTFIQILALFSIAAVSTIAQANPDLEARIVLLSLTQWAEEHITAVTNAATEADLQTAMDAFISKNVAMQFNGASVTRNAYIKSLAATIPGRVGANVTFSSTVQVPTDPQSPVTVRRPSLIYVGCIDWLILYRLDGSECSM
jgi:hypothetical protein